MGQVRFNYWPAIRKFHCRLCDYKTCRKGDLKTHMFKHSSSTDESRRFVCLFCAKSYKYPTSLRKHVRSVCEKDPRYRIVHKKENTAITAERYI